MKQRWLVVAMVGVVAVVNLVGFVLWKQRRELSPTQTVVTSPQAPAREDPEEVERYRNARARRATGVTALEAGDYDKALINFTEAQALIGENAKVAELLKVTEDLRARAQQQAAAATNDAPAPRSAPPPAPVASPRPQPARVVAPAPRPRVEEKPAPAPTPAPEPRGSTGMLLVSTTPRGLLVELDGTALDLTPMRAPVKAGSHQVALRDGDRRVFETTIEVYEGQVATVLKDLTAELAPAPTPVARRDDAPAPPPATEVAAPAPAPAPVKSAAPAPAPAPRATGGLQVTSPGLYGEIWLNGRPQGFPPLTLSELTPGEVKLEVRVNGVVKRSSTVAVEAGQLKPVRLVR